MEDLVQDGSEDAAMLARTAFEIQYDDGFVMVDAGMDRQVNHFFEKDGPQPFNDTLAAKVVNAVRSAKLILITHDHGDHVANVVRLNDNNIPSKTILTNEQVDALKNDPQMPEIKIPEEKSKRYIVLKFQSVLPVALGMVLIKAPGRTNGEIMVYTRLENGREFIFTGDVSWTYTGIENNKLKPASERKRVAENKDNIKVELNWLHDRLKKDNIIMLVSHDDVELPLLAARGIIHNGF